MNRKILLAAIFPVSFFLVFLGIRNPDLKGNSRPKPRPRAVVENVENAKKIAQETCSKQQQEIESCQPLSVDFPKHGFSSINQDTHKFTFHTVIFFSSRAPPFSLAKLS
jgi:hypothetical protein